MQYILSFVVSRIPLLAISFVTTLILYKLYVKIRSNFKVNVNCWFCNQNTKVPYLESNSFTCSHCEQYNGFTKDGDYNKEIYQQLDCSNLMSSGKDDHQGDLMDFSDNFPSNGFCHVCNEGQRLKVEKLAQFEPKNESKFDEELKVYKNQLEEQYRLCTTCDRHLKRVLREKKKMVLGSKFLDFIIKGAETFRKPHFARVKNAQKLKLKRKISLFLAFVAMIHAFCIIKTLPDLSKDNVTGILGDKIGHYIFLMISHVLALIKVLATYSEMLSSHETVHKLGLFLKTIIMMILYSMGAKLPQMAALNMSSMLAIVSPFVMLVLAFSHNLVDGFKLSRYTFMLTLWSLCAGGLLDYEMLTSSKDIIVLAASGLTVYLSLTTKSDASVDGNDDTNSSFHKIYSESCLSDEDTRETLSLLSQKLNSSDNSVMSGCSNNKSFLSQSRLSPVNGRRLTKSPITSSVNSLNSGPRSPTFRSFCQDGDQTVTRNRSYAASLSSFPTNRSLFDLNAEPLFHRPLSNFGANTSFNTALSANSKVNSFNKHSDESLQKPKHTSNMYTSAPLASPFSVSSNAVYQRSNLLTPSRFSTNSQATNNPSASWLSGGYFNSARKGAAQQPAVEKCNFFLEHRNGMSTIQENISRASSHSSGFESQSSATLRENSTCPEQEQNLQVTTPVSECHYGFYPIDNASLFPRPPSLLNNSFQTPLPSPAGHIPAFSLAGNQHNQHPYIQPLSVNCNQDYWKPNKSHHAHNSISNAFNLRKINEELPPIQRGALLKKWKENHVLS